MQEKVRIAALLGALLALGGCFDDEANDEAAGANPPAHSNQVPVISGSPPTSVVEGEFYEFTPSASDADGDTLQFSIARKPLWADFDPQTGRISGTPTSADVGNFTNITLSVSDGSASADLQAFDISVHAFALGTATLSWYPPTANSDGSALTNLAGYRIYYGRNPNDLTRAIILNNPGLTSYVVENLSPATWYFSMSSVNTEGVESVRTGTVSKTIT